MKIGIYGCSWVAGVYPTHYNLAESIAEKCPHHTIYDYAFGGHSTSMILHLFEKFKHNHDFNIIKITSPGRLTLFNNYNFEVVRAFKTPNFNTWKDVNDYGRNVIRLNYNSMPNDVAPQYSLKTIKKLHNLYYSHTNVTLAEDEFDAIASYMISSADFVYGHKHYTEKTRILKKTEKMMPNFKSYLIDNGHHLSKEGILLEADWIIKNVIDAT
jgi:hypothetical protein